MTPRLADLKTALATHLASAAATPLAQRLARLWRAARPHPGYLTGAVLVALLLWQVADKLAGPDRYGTDGFEAMTVIALPPYPRDAVAAAPAPTTETVTETDASQPLEVAPASPIELARATPAPRPSLRAPGRPNAPDTVISDGAAAPLSAPPTLDLAAVERKLAPLDAASESALTARDQVSLAPATTVGLEPPPQPLPAMLVPGKLTASIGAIAGHAPSAARIAAVENLPIEPAPDGPGPDNHLPQNHVPESGAPEHGVLEHRVPAQASPPETPETPRAPLAVVATPALEATEIAAPEAPDADVADDQVAAVETTGAEASDREWVEPEVAEPEVATPEATAPEATAPEAAEPETTTRIAAAPTGLAVNRFILTRGIADREPIDESHTFSTADRAVYAFASFRNLDGPSKVTFAWYRKDTVVDTTTLTIGQAPSWRTWSKSGIQPGRWQIKITDAAGAVLAETTFTVE